MTAPIPGTNPTPTSTNAKTNFAYVPNAPFVDPNTGMLSVSGQRLLNQQILPALKTAVGVTSFTYESANGVNGAATTTGGAVSLELSLGNITPSAVDCSGTVTATEFVGNGQGLTDIPISAIIGTETIQSSIYTTITQANHNFVTGQAVYFNGTLWVLAQANNSGTLGIGIVSYVDINNFDLYQTGLMGGLSNLAPGNYYFVSDQTAGLLTQTIPSATTSFQNPLLLAITAQTGLVLPFRPSEVMFPTNYAPNYDFLLDSEPMTPSTTYTATWNGAVITNEAWYQSGPTLLKNIAYTYTGSLLTQEVRKIFYSDGVTVVAQSTISYTYTNNVISSATYVRNI